MTGLFWNAKLVATASVSRVWGKSRPEKILSPSVWFICLHSVAVTGVEEETDRAKDRRGEVDTEPADSWKKIKISHITSLLLYHRPTHPRCTCTYASEMWQTIVSATWHTMENKTENKQNESQSLGRCISYAEEVLGNKREGQSLTDGGACLCAYVCVCICACMGGETGRITWEKSASYPLSSANREKTSSQIIYSYSVINSSAAAKFLSDRVYTFHSTQKTHTFSTVMVYFWIKIRFQKSVHALGRRRLASNSSWLSVGNYHLCPYVLAEVCVSFPKASLIWILQMWNLQGGTRTHINRQMSLGIMQKWSQICSLVRSFPPST